MPLLRNRSAFFGPPVSVILNFLPRCFVIGDEELFDLRQKSLAHIGNGLKILMLVGMDGRTEKPAVLFSLAILGLLGIYETEDPKFDQTAKVSGRIHQHNNVEG